MRYYYDSAPLLSSECRTSSTSPSFLLNPPPLHISDQPQHTRLWFCGYERGINFLFDSLFPATNRKTASSLFNLWSTSTPLPIPVACLLNCCFRHSPIAPLNLHPFHLAILTFLCCLFEFPCSRFVHGSGGWPKEAMPLVLEPIMVVEPLNPCSSTGQVRSSYLTVPVSSLTTRLQCKLPKNKSVQLRVNPFWGSNTTPFLSHAGLSVLENIAMSIPARF